MEFPLPIVACNLMIEYSEFYENILANSETLQCPRCSASVPATPGVCAQCGENVYQCHKCRAINYDEKDPFLCNSCGFCKYAKFDYTLTAKPTCAVDAIENEDDRKKTVQSLNTMLEKADRTYKNLLMLKPTLEVLLMRSQDHAYGMEKLPEETNSVYVAQSSQQVLSAAGGALPSVYVNRAIQQIAHKYCYECKGAFDELSKMMQKILASRKELVDYDNRQREKYSSSVSSQRRASVRVLSSPSSVSGRCYGCASATVEHCITLLKAMATLPKFRQVFCANGLLRELLDYSLHNNSSMLRSEARQLLCNISKDSLAATLELNNMIIDQISAALDTRSGRGRLDLGSSVRHCIALLICSLDPEDSCWEQRLRCLMQVFMMGISADSAIIQEAITLPCLRIIIKLVKPDSPTSKRNKDKSVDALATVCPSGSGVVAVDLNKWMTGEVDHSFRAWKQRTSKKPSSLITFQGGNNRLDARSSYLSEKYGHRWYNKTLRKLGRQLALELSDTNWLKALLFNRFSRTIRVLACSLVEALYAIPSRSKEMIDMLTSCLCDLGSTGEFGFEFFATFHSLVQKGDWRYYLALKGTLLRIGCLISNEIEILNELEETTLNSSLSEGSALKMLVDILTVFVEVPAISKKFKSRLITFVLDGYLSLRKLVVQRTKLIDETQDALLELLEEMTTGTETEMSSFMEVCLDAVAKCNLDDLRTPVFIFERLCSIIFPEENDSSEFFITLEKDPQQEDFLQGRMLGNPYPSNEPGLGPLMRDIKNKICQDCELVALLDDDSGMELLICNKIISLDLTVKQVYRKVWCVENSESEAMRVVYRMRGLMGDATEEFIESLDSKENKQVDDEHVYRMATVMSKRNGLEILFQRLDVVSDLSPRCRPLLLVLLKLLGHCTKVKSNRQRLIDAPLKAVDTLLKITKMALVASPSDIAPATGSGTSAGQPNVLEQLLSIMEIILREASYLNGAQFDLFSRTCGTSADITFLLTQSSLASSNAKSNTLVKQLLMRLLAFLALGSWEKMDALLAFFSLRLQFKRFDFEHTADDEQFFDSFAMLANAIEVNENGNRLKDVILKESNIVTDAIEYLTIHAPQAKTALLAASDEWKEFTQRPALRFVLKILTGLCTGHLSTQLALVSAGTIPVVHGLEQVSSDSHAGSLAEELLETLKENETVAATIAMVRRQTKEEKKRLAMAVREKQLGELGLRTNIYGQVTATSEVLKQVGDLDEESGLVCNICREGYQFQPTKVLGLYTFTKRCPVEAVEGHSPSAKSTRKTMGYSTVTHFNVVHVDCHMAAVRHARGRDEWESAALQNASTRCNGLLPLWGPQVAESAFASALARHNTYLQEATGHRDVNPQSSVHDLKLLLVKFATEESFSVDSGGGGPQSNIHLIPYLAHHVLYVLNTTRAAVREVKKCASFLETPANKWPEAAFDAESVHYWATMYLLLNSAESWNKDRLTFLKRFLFQAHVRRNVSSSQATQLSSSVHEYSAYKPSLVFFGLINLCYTTLFKGAQKSDMGDWSLSLAEFIRHKDQQLYENGEKMLETYQSDLLTCESFAEFCDVTSLSSTCITNPDEFLSSLF
ncbi:E3 ubiquitin-protein ligase UBR4 [Halotydeus destructor]|nr:E3 ubiquitin-protein ligase UBR4 [Halotydeus destructor]